MSLDTFSDLRNEIAGHLDESASDQIDTFIRIAESRHRTDIRLREMLTRASLTVDDRYVSLPDGFLEAINIRLLTNPVALLESLTPEAMTRFRQVASGKPRFFAIASDIEFDRAPDQTYSGEITYYQGLTALSDSNPTNTLLTLYPDAYLYAALAASAPYQMADERLPVWESMYQQAVRRINMQAAKSRKVGPLVARVQGYTP